jgi:ubiquinone/menaquinone biosynthesis C-methylase UbiE
MKNQLMVNVDFADLAEDVMGNVNEMTMEYHNPVLLQESVDGLNINPDGVYVDVTFGGGGHSKEILKHLGPNGKLFAFDQDEDALANALPDERFVLINENFRYIKRFLVLWCEKSGWNFSRFRCFISSI